MNIKPLALTFAFSALFVDANAQTPPKAPPSPTAATITAAATAAGELSCKPLDGLVKHFQNQGYTISHLHRDLNADGTLKHYSFDADSAMKNNHSVSSDRRHWSVDVSLEFDDKSVEKKPQVKQLHKALPPTLPVAAPGALL